MQHPGDFTTHNNFSRKMLEISVLFVKEEKKDRSVMNPSRIHSLEDMQMSIKRASAVDITDVFSDKERRGKGGTDRILF